MRSDATGWYGEAPRFLAALACVALVVGCGGSEEMNKKAFEACLGAAKAPGSKVAEAKFEAFESAKVVGSTGEEELRVSIPYELAGRKDVHQCVVQRQRDGSFKVVF